MTGTYNHEGTDPNVSKLREYLDNQGINLLSLPLVVEPSIDFHDVINRDPYGYPHPWNFIREEAHILYERDHYKYRAHKSPYATVPILGQPFWWFYYAHRHIDDVMDNKREIDGDRFDYCARLIYAIQTGEFNFDNPIELAEYRNLTYLQRNNPFEYNPRVESLRSFLGIYFDGLRGEKREVLTEAQLEYYYKTTFESVLRLTEMTLGAKFPPEIMELLIKGEGLVYTCRDLKEDVEDGIINIPKEVLDRAGLNGESSYEELIWNEVVTEWMKSVCGWYLEEHVKVEHLVRGLRRPGSFRLWIIAKTTLDNLRKEAERFVGVAR